MAQNQERLVPGDACEFPEKGTRQLGSKVRFEQGVYGNVLEERPVRFG
jgi:hypothetical protein